MTQPHYIDREAVALWGCADGNGVDPRLVFRDRATADQVAADTDMVVKPLYTERAAPMEAVAWRDKVARIIDPSSAPNSKGQTAAMRERWERALAKASEVQALAVIPTQGGEGQ